MKIAIIGNMNNMMTPTAINLAEQGHDVTFFMLFEYDHFHPNADYWQNVDLGVKIVNLNLQFGEVLEISKKKLKEWFWGFDYYIGMDWSPALLARIGLRLNMYQPAGTDIIYWPFCSYNNRFKSIWQCQNLLRAWLQNFGIRKTQKICLSEENDLLTNALDKMNIPGTKKTWNLPHLNVPLYLGADYFSRTEMIEKVNAIKKDCDLLIFQHVRQWWIDGNKMGHYRNDKLIKAFGLFVKKSGINAKLLLSEYGPDVDKSKELIQQLNIGDKVIWLPKMLRREIMYYVNACDIWVGELGTDSYIQYGSLLEAMICGRTSVSYWNKELYTKRFSSLPDIISVETEFELADIFKRVAENLPILDNEKNKSWIKEFIWEKPLGVLYESLKTESGKNRLSLLNIIRIKMEEFKYNLIMKCNVIMLIIKKPFNLK